MTLCHDSWHCRAQQIGHLRVTFTIGRLRINNKFLTVNSRYLMMQHMEFGQTLDDSGQPYRLPSAVLQGLKIKIWYRQTLTFKIKLKDSIMVVTAMCTSVIGRFCQATVALSMTTIRPAESYKSATPQASFGIDHQVNFFLTFTLIFDRIKFTNEIHHVIKRVEFHIIGLRCIPKMMMSWRSHR